MREFSPPNEIHRKVFELTLALYRVTDFFPQGETLRKNLREKANEIFGHINEYGFSEGSAEEMTAIIAKMHAIKGFFGVARAMRFVKPINIAVLEREYALLADFFLQELRALDEQKSREKEKETDSTATGDTVKTIPKQGEIRTVSNTMSNTIFSASKGQDPRQLMEEKAGSPIREELSTWNEFRGGKELDISGAPEAEKKMPSGLKKISSDLNERQKIILEELNRRAELKVGDLSSVFQHISSKTIQRDLQDLVAKSLLKRDGEKRWTVYSLNNVQ